jgi:aminotransferase
MALPDTYYQELATAYRQRRDVLCDALARVGFGVHVPDGAYYVMCDTAGIDPDRDDVAFARRLVETVGVAAVPGSSFYADPLDGAGQIRFAFPKRIETLLAAAERLAAVARD